MITKSLRQGFRKDSPTCSRKGLKPYYPYLSVNNRDNPHQNLTKEETTSLRVSLEKLNWLAGMTRPEVSFEVYQISTTVKNATVADILAENKVIKFFNFLGIKLIFQRNFMTVKGYRKPWKCGKRNSINHIKVYITGKLTKNL